jgi:hypothetical protein
MTRGILNNFEVASEGSKVVGLDPVSAEQLEAVYDRVASFLGVSVAPAGSAFGGSPPGAGGHLR